MSHNDSIRDQFTKQAVPFSTAPGIQDEAALKLVLDMTGASPADTSLDVACGPGIVVCAFAEVVQRATGIDLTPAMIDRARALQAQKGLRNVELQVGDVLPLPYSGGAFSIVTCRYSFHHFLDPREVLREMRRVCRPGGCVCVIDVMASTDASRAAAYNRMEKLRDPSHVRAMPLAELVRLFQEADLPQPRAAFYNLAVDVDGLLERSFPDAADVPVIRRMFAESLADDGLGMQTRKAGSSISGVYPIAVLASTA